VEKGTPPIRLFFSKAPILGEQRRERPLKIRVLSIGETTSSGVCEEPRGPGYFKEADLVRREPRSQRRRTLSKRDENALQGGKPVLFPT